MMRATDFVVSAVRERRDATASGVLMVALDGRSGAGKSTLAAAIADAVEGAVVHVDDFYRDMPDTDRLKLSPTQGTTVDSCGQFTPSASPPSDARAKGAGRPPG